MFHLLRKSSTSSTISPLLSSSIVSSSSSRRRVLISSNTRTIWNYYGSAATNTGPCGYGIRYYNTTAPLLVNSRTKQLYSSATNVVKQQESHNSHATSSSSSSISKRLELVTDKVRAKMQWNLSDFFSVVSAFTLLTGIIFGPYVVEKMKKSKNSYDDFVVDDEFTNLMQVFQEYRNEVLNKEESSTTTNSNNSNNPMVSLVVDVCKQVIDNPDIQQSLQSLAIRILKSPSVQDALQNLSQETSTKLLQDKELQKNVILLFQGVLADKRFQSSALTLLVSLLQDDTFQTELVNMIVRISQNEKILEATKALLTESAHKTLVDPEILDHSMEFAADVVGDDFVQRTSGEALWNTISYSIQPAFFSMLYFTGAVLVAFSFVALSKAQFYSNMAAFAALDTTAKTWWWWWCRWASWEYLGQQLRSLATDILSFVVRRPCSALASSAKSATLTFWRVLTSWINEYFILRLWNFIHASSYNFTNGLTAGAILSWQAIQHSLIHTTSLAGTKLVKLFTSLQQTLLNSSHYFGIYCYKGMRLILIEYPLFLCQRIRFHFLKP